MLFLSFTNKKSFGFCFILQPMGFCLDVWIGCEGQGLKGERNRKPIARNGCPSWLAPFYRHRHGDSPYLKANEDHI
ncbi:hypothetical protein [Candidatus Hepatobacter penaei]|uniref:hypothetical protein n=1 Tax=Candidatus Hepatobacter penaei TaxID=1274402 RepID=UPI0010938EB2|nr:hypothetical protein [Candidatus Hepatobacter penaei]TGW14912.1 hypothetical protein EIL50_03155 [bacterium NHP-B]